MLSLAALAANHPTLPTAWTSQVKEDRIGNTIESENYVAKGASAENPSAKWTNYTDGSCQRLIWSDGRKTTRYLYKCDAVNCCHEDGTNAPIEYQIPNVHPETLAPVSSLGKQTITLYDGKDYQADVWTWKFLKQNFTVFTQEGANGTALLRWYTAVLGQESTNDYVGYQAVAAADMPAFVASFHKPDIKCTLTCPKAHEDGQLSAGRLAFLRGEHAPKVTAEPATATPTFLQYTKEKSPSDSCTGGHQFCCPAPQDDCNNCPGGARTGDCCKKGSCCCAFEDLLKA